ncbi:hypothetical protein [Cohnella terricola]|uniref:Glycerophosphoryl diester phosphodiesterase membrane domain-containing protein n=1 Tax=Cohnella terricola TaxID=1289167 RepID=A0A559JIW1_9BACL|nr:hypothetical protein [Cohnella terricola]TVX99817.1 hypothetical protein FPZ45_12800 [Cohnella terricola]
MQQEVMKPMGVGRMLDLSFQLYRKHFVKLMLIMLICYGPFYLVNVLIQGQYVQSLLDVNDIMNYSVSDAEPLISPDIVVLVLLLGVLVVFVLTPVVVASIVFLVHQALQGEEAPSALRLLRMSFKRYWGLLGSSIVFGLILAGLVIALFIAFFVMGVISKLVSGVIGGILFFLLAVGAVFGFYYFAIRFMYFLPVVAHKEDSIGIGRSWGLTRKSFWRLFGLFFLQMLFIYIINFGASFLLALVPMNGILFMLLQLFLSLLTGPMIFVAYAVSYTDLKVRDGMGLEEMINRIVPDPSMPQPPAEHTL